MPDWASREVDQAMVDILWRSKKHHIAKTVLYQPCANGVLNLNKVKSKVTAQRVAWAVKIIDSPDQELSWIVMARFFLGKYRETGYGSYILHLKFFTHRSNVLKVSGFIGRSCAPGGIPTLSPSGRRTRFPAHYRIHCSSTQLYPKETRPTHCSTLSV